MSYLKNGLRLKITVFLLITALIFWLIPSGLIFGDGEEDGEGGTVIELTGDTGGEGTPPADTIAPVITINGDNPVAVDTGAEYIDAGATAVDDVDGEISASIVVNNPVDTLVAGAYSVTYNVSDAAGNAAAEVIRTVNVVESVEGETPPEEPILNPTISTDLSDYGPGDIVIVTGSGWQPGETVTLSFLTLPLNAVVDYYAVADDSGNISNDQYVIYDFHADATIILTATGQTSGLSAQTVFTDSTGSIRIRKWVSGGLTGTFNFTLTKPGYTTRNASITINSGSTYGSTTVYDLHEGNWTVTETQGTGFVCTSPSSYVRSVYVSGYTDDADFTNAPVTYSVTINKSGLLWGGWPHSYADQATFTLTGSGINYSVTLDNSPYNDWGGYPILDHVTWSSLPAGTYTLNESYPGTNVNTYNSNYSFPYTFTLGPSQTFNVVNSTGPSTGTVIIHKDVQTPTGGAVSDTAPTFHFNIDGETAQDIHDEDTITINDVTAGSHYVEETGTIPAGYSFYSISSNPSGSSSGQRVTFDVTSGGTTHVYITNRQCTGTVIVQKVVKNFSGEVVDDDTSFNVTVGTQTLSFSQDSPRSFTVNPGTYGASETTPTNYNIVGNTGSVTVGPGETKYITITNQQKEGHITIIKHGLQDAENAYNDYSMFRLYKGIEQIGETAELDNFIGGPARPNTFTWDGIDWGTYTIVEEYGASNYYTYTIDYDPSDTVVIGAGNLNETVDIYNNDPQIKTGEITIHKTVIGTAKDGSFIFTVDDGVNTPYTVNISGSGGNSSPITVEAGKTYTITENDPGACWDTEWTTTIPGATDVDGGITFSVDGDNIADINGKSVSFENTRKTATITIEKDVIGPTLGGIDIFNFTATGESPFALADGESINITIECGIEYAVTETLPNLNWLSDISDDGKIEILSETANSVTFKGTQDAEGDLQDSTITFTNTRKSGTVTITKRIIDSLTGIDYEPTIGTFGFGIGYGPAGISFSLTGPDYSETLDVWCGLEYTVFEESTDPELVIVTAPITFTATEGDNGTKTFFNRTGSITVVKVDETDGALLEGAILGLFEADGTTPATDAFGNPVSDQVTNADGEAYFTKLALGDYVVKEITAPTGYSVADPMAVSLNTEVSDFGFAIKDPRIPGRVTVIKTDPAGAPLDGVGFTIYYKASGNPVMPERLTSGGLVTFDGLVWGSYTIVETTPPAGYDTSDPVDVIIDASNAESGVTVSRIDTPTAGGGGLTVLGIASPGTGIEVLGISELPFTGMSPLIPISGISTIFAGGLMVVLSTIRKKFGKK